MKKKIHIYYDSESDYIELIFGKPTESYFEKIGPDTFVRIDERTKEKKGYAIFNLRKSTSPLRTLDVEIPAQLVNSS